MAVFEFDFSKLPSDVALLLSQQPHTRNLAASLGRALDLEDDDIDALHQEMVGTVASMIERYLP